MCIDHAASEQTDAHSTRSSSQSVQVLPGDRAAQAVSDEFAVLDPGVADRMGENGALAARARTGRGEHLDVSMWEKSLTALAWAVSDYLLAGRQPTANDNENPTGAPSATFMTGSDALKHRRQQARTVRGLVQAGVSSQ